MASADLRHPIRVRALEAMNLGWELSATVFIQEGMHRGMEELGEKTYDQQIGEVSYHLRALRKAGSVYVSREAPRRGAKEVFYRANAVAYFSDEDWADLNIQERRPITRVVAQGLIAQIEGAIMAGTFDSRPDRWLLYEPLELDEQGWCDLRDAIARMYGEVRVIQGESSRRLGTSGGDCPPIRTTFGVTSFESPGLPRFGNPPPHADAPDDPE
jgi:DNA-binding transcriptional ArsR family regulator